MKKVIIAFTSTERVYELYKLANQYADNSRIAVSVGDINDVCFYPNDDWDLIHLEEVLQSKNFQYRIENIK